MRDLRAAVRCQSCAARGHTPPEFGGAFQFHKTAGTGKRCTTIEHEYMTT
jgi:hypothetical protein